MALNLILAGLAALLVVVGVVSRVTDKLAPRILSTISQIGVFP